MKFVVTTIIEANTHEEAQQVRNELAAALEDARESGELPPGSSFETWEALPVADHELVRNARAMTGFDDNVRIDSDAPVSEAEGANWVQAWVRVPVEKEEA